MLTNQMPTLPSFYRCILALALLAGITSVAAQTSSDLPWPAKLDSLMNMGIDSMAFPGGQLLIAHKGQVLHEKSYGYHTYDRKREVRMTDLYDLASVTKVTAAVPALMYMVDKELISLDQTLCEMWPLLCGSNKEHLTLRQALAHQGGLIPYIVFWQEAQRKNGKWRPRSFKTKKSSKYPIEITNQLYLHRSYTSRMFKKVRKSEVDPQPEYLYSGLTFLMYPQLVERKLGQPIDSFLYQHFYDRLGAARLRFRPLDDYSIDEIVPTEIDTFFRMELVQGTVHDEAAAMLNGVSTNAGLFAAAPDLLKLLQLYLDGGSQDGDRLLSKEVIDEFTRCQYCDLDNRRGLGFDKPLIEYDSSASYVAKSASPASFGHSGFTGTFFWVDPESELVFILLTNRVYPNRNQRKLYGLNLRPQLHQLAYDWIAEIKKGEP